MKEILLLILLLLLLQACAITKTSEDVYLQSIREAEMYCNKQINPPPLVFVQRGAFDKLVENLPNLKGAIAAHIRFNNDNSCIIVIMNEYQNSYHEKHLFDHELGHHIFHCVRGLKGKRASELFARKYSE